MTNNKSVIDTLNDIASSAISQTLNKCKNSGLTQQNIILRCNPKEGNDPIPTWTDNRTCLDSLTKRLSEASWRKTLSNTRKITDMDAALKIFEAGLNRDVMQCVACNFNNITMTSNVSLDVSCINTDIQAIDMAAAITQMTTQSITNNSDWGAGLARVFGEQSQLSVIQKLSTAISNSLQWENITSNVSAELSRTTIEVSDKDATADQSNIHQDNVIDIVANFVSSSNYADNVFTEDQWSIINDIYNDDSSVGDFLSLSHSFFSFLGQITDNVMGTVIICAAILAFVAMGIVFFQYLVPKLTAKKVAPDKSQPTAPVSNRLMAKNESQLYNTTVERLMMEELVRDLDYGTIPMEE